MKTKLMHISAVIFLALVPLNSCETNLEDLIFTCNSTNYPVINTEQLRDGKVGEFYSDHVSAEIKNDPNDDSDYDYYFDVSGVLPDGIGWYIDSRINIYLGCLYKARQIL